MGLPEDVSVLAWGLSLERYKFVRSEYDLNTFSITVYFLFRPTMIKYGYDNIRDLVGPKVNLQMVAENPLCRLDK